LQASDWVSLNAAYGTRVDPEKLRLVRAPALPGVNGPRRFSHLQVRHFERFCHGLASDFDLCLSAYNPIFFGRPAIHLVGDFSFSEEMRRRLQSLASEPLRHRATMLRKLYLSIGQWMEMEKPPLREWGDLVLANSQWAARQLEEHFQISCPGVLHPPVPLPTAPAGGDRIVPEKEIERMIDILAQVRAQGFPVTFTLIGDIGDSDYSRGIGDLAARQGDWIATPGFLHLERKQAVLASHTFALHACRIEAFGIAVAEMAAMGCIPFVPTSGGAGEIVPFSELQYTSDDEAVAKITALLRDPARVRELAATMPAQAVRFAPPRFVERLRAIVLEFLRADDGTVHEAPQENLRASH
jgi:glycosyltransferase involved in cell wall biosynthesis